MSRWDEETDFVDSVARRAEFSVLRLGEDERTDTQRSEWRVGVGGLPPVVVIRHSDGGVEVAVDIVSAAVPRIKELKDQPREYIAASSGVGAVVGAILGRSRGAAALGGVVGGALGLLSVLSDHSKRRNG